MRKLYENNLLRYSAVREYSWQNIAALNYGKKTASKKIKVSIPRNKEVNYALNLNQLPTDWKPGVYGLSLVALDLDGSRTGDVQLVVNVTDLAPQSVLDHRNHQAFIAVRRISDGSACAGAQVTLVSHKHQVLASGVADAAGLVRLDYSRSPAGTDPEDYPDALLVKSGNDLVFQRELFHRGHSLAEFESDGNPVTGREGIAGGRDLGRRADARLDGDGTAVRNHRLLAAARERQERHH